MKKLFLLTTLLFATPALAVPTPAANPLATQQAAVAAAKVALAQHKAANDADMATVTAAYQAAMDALNLAQAQQAQSALTTSSVSGR